MQTPLYADSAIGAMAAARPQLVSVVPARAIVPHLAAGGACHAGPPIAPQDMCPPMRAALGVALAMEGLAPTPAEALVLADDGAVPVLPSHDAGGVGPMSGIVTGSMPVLVARDPVSGAEAWCPLNEGSGKVLRYGADDEEVVARLAWMRDTLGPALDAALVAAGELDLIALQREALLAGDECHHRTHAGTALLLDILSAHVPADVAAFIAGNHQFFLNVAMVAAKVATVAAADSPGSALVTVLARNGVEVGVKLSGTGERWFTGPAAAPSPARLAAGFSSGDMQRDLGDSAIVEVYGLGALAVAASPESRRRSGWTRRTRRRSWRGCGGSRPPSIPSWRGRARTASSRPRSSASTPERWCARGSSRRSTRASRIAARAWARSAAA